MNQPSRDCNQQRIADYLRVDQDGPDPDLIQHLDTCEACRSSMEKLAAAADAWRTASDLLRPSDFDCASSPDFSAAGTPFQQPDIPREVQSVLDALVPSEDPARLGRLETYEVTGVVGAGGMGVVLKALDPSLDRVVAIKVLSPHLASSASARRRFAREAKAAAAVLHPNVIPIHCVSSDTDTPYLVMSYVRGGSLQARLDEKGPLKPVEILRIGAQIAAGLAAAHEQGLVHRDVKPANILLEQGVERVTLTDFGLARAVDDASLTQEGTLAGTPQFMSPEQARGEAIDQRSDLFSLGSVLYTLCTGLPPFRADSSYGVMRQIIETDAPPIREQNPAIPEWLTQIVRRLMAKEVDSRFASAQEVRALLEECISHIQQPDSTPLPDALQGDSERRARLFSPRSILGVTVMLSVLVSLSIAFWPSQSEAPPAGSRVGPSIVHEVVQKGTSAELQRLLETGSNGDETDRMGRTPLQLSALLRREDMVRVLLDHGVKADVDALNFAAEGGSPAILDLLLAQGVNVNANSGTGAPLKYAAWSGKINAVRLLLDRGAEVDAEQESGRTALRYAAWGCEKNSESACEVAEMLLAAGADPNSTADDGFSPLHEAVLRNDDKLSLILIEAGATINQLVAGESPWTGKTPVDIALKSEHLAMVELLRKFGGTGSAEASSAAVIPETWEELGIKDVPEDYPTDVISLIHGLSNARGEWIFTGSMNEQGQGESLEGRLKVAGDFQNSMKLGQSPSWPMNLAWTKANEEHSLTFILMTPPGPKGIELLLMLPPNEPGTQPAFQGGMFKGQWDALSETITWTLWRRMPSMNPAQGTPKPLPGKPNLAEGEVAETLLMKVSSEGRIAIETAQPTPDGVAPSIQGGAKLRVGEPVIQKELKLTPLPGGYGMFFASRTESSLHSADGDDVAGPRIELMGIEGATIYGKVAEHPNGIRHDQGKPGYFLVDTRSGALHRGLSLEDWENKLSEVGVNNPKMLSPDTFGPRS